MRNTTITSKNYIDQFATILAKAEDKVMMHAHRWPIPSALLNLDGRDVGRQKFQPSEGEQAQHITVEYNEFEKRAMIVGNKHKSSKLITGIETAKALQQAIVLRGQVLGEHVCNHTGKLIPEVAGGLLCAPMVPCLAEVGAHTEHVKALKARKVTTLEQRVIRRRREMPYCSRTGNPVSVSVLWIGLEYLPVFWCADCHALTKIAVQNTTYLPEAFNCRCILVPIKDR